MSASPGIKFAQEHLMQIIFQEQVTASQSKKKSKRKKENLIITDQVLLLEDGTEINYFFWVKISSINISGKEIVVSTETEKKGNDMTIQFSSSKTDIKQIFAIISDLLQRILLPKTYQFVNSSKFYTEPPKVTGQSIISRFLGYYQPNDQTEIENSNIFRLKTMTKNPILKLTEFKSYQKMIPAVFYSISFINFINYLELGESDSILDDLIKFFEIAQKINHISFGCINKTKFTDFLKKFTEKKNIEGISISNSSLEIDECQNFISTIKNAKISSLGLHKNSLSTNGFTTFSNNVNSISNLIYLNFNGNSNFNFDSLSSKISFITVLSLSNCNLDLQKSIKSIFQNNFIKLSELDLSSNLCKSSFNIKEDFPPKLSKLVVGNINWRSSSNLFSFVSYIFKKMNSILKLNLYSSKIDDLNEWKNFYSKLSKLTIDLSSIHSIGWDNNPIDSGFFTFVEKCVNLKTLSISSFSTLNGKSIDSLIKYIKNAKNKNIKTLILSSNDSNKSKFKSQINEVFDSLVKWKSLETLDISQNMIGDDGIKSLQNFLNKNQIKLVIFDRSSPSSIKSLVDFFNAIPKECKVNFPCDDILAFLNAKKSNLADIQELIQLSSKMIGDVNSNIINPKAESVPNAPHKNKKLLQKPEKSPLDQQFFVFSDHEYKSDLYLPEYIKSNEYKPLEVTKRIQKKEQKENDDESEENESDNPKKKKATKKKKNENDDESEENESDNKSKRKNKKSKNHESESDDDYSDNKNVKKNGKSKKKYQESSTSDDEYDDYNQKKKKNKKQINNYEMRTLMPQSSHPNRKSSPKSLMGNSRNDKSKMSIYEMRSKVAHHSYLGNGKESNKRKRSNKFDDIDENYSSDSYSDQNYGDNRRNKKTKKKQPPKIIDIDESSDDLNENSFGNELRMTNKKSVKNRVQQRAPPPLEGSDYDNDNYDDNDVYDRKIKPKFKSKSLNKNDDDDDDENNVSPKPPDWSFPLVFVPPPDDSKQIVDDLSEKYSVGNLLRYMYQS